MDDKTSVPGASGAEIQYKAGDIVDGTYRLQSPLGKGGMGVVFACTHLALNQNYAIKLLADTGMSGENWTRFQVEAKALARLNHPGIVAIYNMGIDGGLVPYYVMDLLSGETLDQLIHKSGRLPVEQVLDYFIQIADAISVAHAQDIIHRDIKPSNLMLVRDSSNKITGVKVVDFGIARLSNQGFKTQSQTATGLIFGTPYYMSPEQCQGSRVDLRSDIYSLGCTIFEALTGAPPFRGESAFHTFMMHQNTPAPRLSARLPQEHFPDSLELCLSKMLSKDPADRYQSMGQVKHDLERIKKGKDITTAALAKTSQGLPGGSGYNEDGGGESSGATNSTKLFLVSALLFVIVMVAVGAGAYAILSKNASTNKMESGQQYKTSYNPISPIISIAVDPDSLRQAGCSEKEVAFLKTYDSYTAHKEQEEVEHQFARYMENALKANYHFLNKQGTAFMFPPNYIIGEIAVGNTKPVPVYGVIPIIKGSDVCFYQNYCIRDQANFVKLFHLDDLTGLELCLHRPGEAIREIKNWKRLKHLCFYDSLTKPVPGWENFDRSRLSNKDLVEIDKMQNLQSLGLCGPDISSEKVAQMSLLKKVSALRLKNIYNMTPLLQLLPQLGNIKELWLNGLEIQDQDLEALTAMPNLESLRITRTLITPKSLPYFKRMHSLKKLSLDRYWTEADQEQFKAELPIINFETVLDTSYWNSYPKH